MYLKKKPRNLAECQAQDPMTFWEFIDERHKIYVMRDVGSEFPWTCCPILQTYRFTNVFRELDATTIHLRKNEPHAWSAGTLLHDEHAFKSLLFYAVATRWFNRIDVVDKLLWHPRNQSEDTHVVGHLDPEFWNHDAVERHLREWRPKGPWVTGAYIIHTPNGKGWDKLTGVVEDINEIWLDLHNLYERWNEEDQNNWEGVSLEWATNDLTRYRDIGEFMAYEIVSDLRWNLLKDAPDINTWANPGPGARRGLGWVQEGDPDSKRFQGKKANAQCQLAMRDLLVLWLDRRGPTNNGTLPEMRDVEHSLCEYDKWRRTHAGLGRPRGKFQAK